MLEVIRAFEKASGQTIPFEIVPRREGDIAANWGDPSRAEKLLGWRAHYDIGWRARYDIDDMCRDAWRFESMLEG